MPTPAGPKKKSERHPYVDLSPDPSLPHTFSHLHIHQRAWRWMRAVSPRLPRPLNTFRSHPGVSISFGFGVQVIPTQFLLPPKNAWMRQTQFVFFCKRSKFKAQRELRFPPPSITFLFQWDTACERFHLLAEYAEIDSLRFQTKRDSRDILRLSLPWVFGSECGSGYCFRCN